MTQEILNSILGNRTLAQYVVAFFFILLGVLISIRLGAYKRDKESPNTPFKFSYTFLTRDNIVRAIGSIAIAFVFIRFGQEILHIEVNELGAFTIGLTFDRGIALLDNWQKGARK